MAKKSTQIARSALQKRAGDELRAAIRLLGLGQRMLSRGVPLTTLRRTMLGRGSWKMVWATFDAACAAVEAAGAEPGALAELTRLRHILRKLEDEHTRLAKSDLSGRTSETSAAAFRLELSATALRTLAGALDRLDPTQYIELRHSEFAIHIYRSEGGGGAETDYRLGYDVTSRVLRV